MKRKGQVDMKSIGKIILVLICLGILIFILVPGIKNMIKGIFITADKYGTPKLELTNNYMFTAEQVYIINSFDSKCTTLETDPGTNLPTVFECKKDNPENFAIIMQNDGYKMRTFHGGIVVCKSGDKDCCGNSQSLASTGADDCTLTPGEKKACTAGTYTFDGAYKEYEVHPVADCLMDATYGCYSAGMSSSVKSCNPSKYITVKITS